MALFPSEEWLYEYCRALNECDELEAFGFSESVLLEITDLGLDRLSIADLDEELLADVPSSVVAALADIPLSELVARTDERVRSALPDPVARLLAQAERNVVDDSLYVYVELDQGACFGPVLVDSPEAVDYRCVFSGPATVWQSVVDGRPAAAAIMSGDLRVRGNPVFLVKHVAELQLLCDVAAENVETAFFFDRPTRSLTQAVVDESVRHPIDIQKALTREAMLAVRTLTPL